MDTKVYRRERFHKDTMQEGYTVNLTVRYIARKWTLLILLELYKGEGHTRRFSELKSCMGGITQKVLSAPTSSAAARTAANACCE
jgi:DNA-binding HxlR family transcriptional regulator